MIGVIAVTAAATTPWWVAPAVIAAIIAAIVALTTLSSQAHRARLDRQRSLFADAYAAAVEYCEYPYIIRRREAGSSERVRISTAMSEVQHRLTRHQALVDVEAPWVGRHFEHLVAETRRIAGAACHHSWTCPVLDADGPANVTDIDLSGVLPAQRAYLTAVRDHLSPIRGRVRRAWRWLASTLAPVAAGGDR